MHGERYPPELQALIGLYCKPMSSRMEVRREADRKSGIFLQKIPDSRCAASGMTLC